MNEKRYYKIILGRGHRYAKECHAGSFIGADFDIEHDPIGFCINKGQN